MSEKIYKNCQSCGMPFSKDVKGGGSEKDSSKSKKYCSYCYTNGEFVGGNVNLQQFSENTKNAMKANGQNAFFAWLFTRPFMLKHLERWKNS